MSNYAELFRDPLEVETRPPFNLRCEITEENFVRIVGKVKFKPDDKVQCQIRKPNGKKCGKKYQDGWLALNQMGHEGYIGGICAGIHFQDNLHYKAEVERATQETEITEYLEVLRLHLDARPTIKEDVQRIHGRLRKIANGIEEVCERLSKKVILKLRDMAKGSATTVYVDYKYFRKDEKGKDVVEWRRQAIGRLQGLTLLLAARSPAFFFAEAPIRCLDEIELERSAGADKLSEWANVVATFAELETETDSLDRRFKNLVSQQNLSLMLLLTGVTEDQNKIIRCILHRQGQREIDREHLDQYIADFDVQIEQRNGNREFKRVHHR